MSLRCTYCFPFSTSCSQVRSNCNSLFSLGSFWWDWDGDPVVWAEQFMAISHHSPGLEPRAATPVSSPGKSAKWKTTVLCDNNNGIAWRDNVTNATVLEQTGSMTMHFIQSQHRWNLQFLTTTCSDEALTPWPSLKPSVLCTLSLYLYHRPKLPNPPPPLPHHHRNPPTYPDKRPNIYPATFKMREVHWSLIRLEQYFHFPLFYAQKRRKKNSYKNSCHSCVHATTEAVLNTEPR